MIGWPVLLQISCAHKLLSSVMEYLGGGEIRWRDEHQQPILQVDQCRRICRDVILGLEYCTWLLHSAPIRF